MYEMLIRFKATGIRRISIDDFRKALCLQDKYCEFKFLKRDVINLGLKEINASSDINVDVEYKKLGRKIVALEFTFKTKKQMSLNLEVPPNAKALTRAQIEKKAKPGETYEQAENRLKNERKTAGKPASLADLMKDAADKIN
jgi:plasmid replication initiation protein